MKIVQDLSPVLEMKGLGKKIGKKQIVRNIDLSLYPSEIAVSFIYFIRQDILV